MDRLHYTYQNEIKGGEITSSGARAKTKIKTKKILFFISPLVCSATRAAAASRLSARPPRSHWSQPARPARCLDTEYALCPSRQLELAGAAGAAGAFQRGGPGPPGADCGSVNVCRPHPTPPHPQPAQPVIVLILLERPGRPFMTSAVRRVAFPTSAEGGRRRQRHAAPRRGTPRDDGRTLTFQGRHHFRTRPSLTRDVSHTAGQGWPRLWPCWGGVGDTAGSTR